MASNIENELNQLKEQIKLLERMVYLKNNVSSSEEYITKYMETQAKLSGIMKDYNANSYNHEKKLLELLKQRAEIEEKRAKSARQRADAEKESIKNNETLIRNNETLKEQNKEIIEQEDEKIQKAKEKAKAEASERVNNALSSRSQQREKQQSEARTNFALNHSNLEGEALKRELVKAGLVDNETSKYMRDMLKDFKIGNRQIGDYVEQNERGISTKARLLSVAVDTFNKAVEVFATSVKQGFKNQTGSYESNFTNIAVRSGMTKETYRNNQMALGGFGTNTLHERGLMNNIKTSEVQDMWNSMANSGMNQADILANALDNVITNKLVPYLDTTSEDFNILNNRIGPDFNKQIRGINKANLEIAGNNYATKEVLDQIMTAVQPMSDEALQNLATGSEEMTALINKLTPTMGKDAAVSYATQLFKTQKYGANDISSMSSSEITGYVNNLQAGNNLYNPEDWADWIATQVDTEQRMANWTPGYNSTTNGLISNTVGNAFGITTQRMMGLHSLTKKGQTGTSLLNDIDSYDLAPYGDNALDDLAGDKLQTTQQLTDILAENLTNEVAAFAEMLGPWFKVITTALQGIAAVVGIKLIGKLGGKLLGIGGSSGGSAAGGLIGSSLTAFAGTGLGYQAMGVGASMGINSVPAATAAGIALPAAIAAGGVAGGAYGISEGVKDWQNDHKVRGGISTAGGVAMAAGGIGVAGGMLAAGAANAWNPVGWALLIGGAVAVAGTALHRYAEEQEKAAHDTGDIMDQLNEQSKLELESYKKESKQKLDQLETIKERLEGTDNLEAQKQILEEAGIASKQELQKEEYNNKEALIALTDQYIASTKTETEELNNTREELYKNRDALLNDASKGIFAMKNSGYDALTEEQKAALPELGRKYYAYLEANKDKDKDAKWRYEKINKKIENGEINLNDDITSQADYDAIFWQGNTKDQTELWKRITSSKDFMKGLSEGDYGNTVRKGIGMNYAATLDYNYAAEQLQAALNVKSEESAQSIMTHLAVMGFNRDNLKSDMLTKVLEKYPNISFRVGTDSIPYDNYPALLHEGEAVLTASTANELRGLVDEYRETKSDNIKIEKAIQDQTSMLITKLDAIYNKIGNPDSDTSIMPGSLDDGGKQMATNMRKMTSLFNT